METNQFSLEGIVFEVKNIRTEKICVEPIGMSKSDAEHEIFGDYIASHWQELFGGLEIHGDIFNLASGEADVWHNRYTKTIEFKYWTNEKNAKKYDVNFAVKSLLSRITLIKNWLEISKKWAEFEMFEFNGNKFIAKRTSQANLNFPKKLYYALSRELNDDPGKDGVLRCKCSENWNDRVSRLIKEALPSEKSIFIEELSINNDSVVLYLRQKGIGLQTTIKLKEPEIGEFESYINHLFNFVESNIDEFNKRINPSIDDVKALLAKISSLEKEIESLRNTQNTTLIVAVID